MKSETYRAIQDEQQHFGGPPRVHEIPITVQHQTYQPTGKVSFIAVLFFLHGFFFVKLK